MVAFLGWSEGGWLPVKKERWKEGKMEKCSE
jgi:hypothetical protein